MFNLNNLSSFVRDRNEAEIKKKEPVFNFLDKKKVEQIQRKKEFLMEELKLKLQEIDKNLDGNVSAENENLRLVGFDGKNYFIYGKKGRKELISLGQIMTASLWGKNLRLSGEVPRIIKKDFLVREYKRKIFNLWNYQIREALDALPQTTYVQGADSILEKNEQSIEDLPAGFAAERMINSFLTRLSYDFQELPFKLEESNVYDDVYQKIDFKLKIKKEYFRSVSVESCREGDCYFFSEIGVQYTLDSSKKEKKEKQLFRVREKLEKGKDLVLVTLPFGGIKEAIEAWKSNQSKIMLDGPENFLPLETRKKIFMAILDRLPENLDINSQKYWDLIKNDLK